MNPHHGRAVARPEEPLTAVILRGGAWTARRIRNNCLRQHCHVLAKTFRRHEWASLQSLCARLFVVLESRSRVLTETHPNDLAVVPAVARLGAYASRWLRQPEDWIPDPAAEPRHQWADLLRHLLARYPVPRSLDRAWEVSGSLEHFDRDCWCALGAGRSLRTVPGLPRSIPQRVLHAAIASGFTTDRDSFGCSIWQAQLQAFKAAPALETAVLTSRIPRELGNYSEWTRLVAKYAAKEEHQAEHFGLVASCLAAVRTQHGSHRLAQLLKLPLPVLLRHCRRFAADLFKAHGYSLTESQVWEMAAQTDLSKLPRSRWQPTLGAMPFASQRGQTRRQSRWYVEELCSVDALREEGRAMRHCVVSYADRCRTEHSAIFSVRHRGMDEEGNVLVTPYATIEVEPTSRKIIQMRGYRNHPVDRSTMVIVREWVAAKGLVCMM